MVNQLQSSDPLRVIRCQSGDDGYALALDQVRGFQRADQVQAGRGPDGRLGRIALPGGDLPVYSLGESLGRASVYSPSAHVVQVGTGRSTWGLLVDHVSRVAVIERERAPALPALLRQWQDIPAERLLEREEEWLLLLRLDRLGPRQGESPNEVPEREDGPLVGAVARDQLVLFETTEPAAGERRISIGLSLRQVGEIVDCPRWVPVPRSPAFVLGVIAWRGRAVPVVDLGIALGWSASVVDRRSRVVLGWGGKRLGWIAFLSRPGTRVVSSSIAHLPCSRTLPFDLTGVLGAVELEDETIVLPNLPRLLLPVKE